MKLGKKPPRIDDRTFRFAKYVRDLPPAPPQVDWLSGIKDWGMMRNDVLGDCTIAAVAHAVQVWSAATGPQFRVTDDIVQYYYEAWDGYNPADPSTDQGGVELDVLNLWRKNGFAGEELKAYADPDPGNIEHIKKSIELFGGVYIGLALPISAQSQTGPDKEWTVVDSPVDMNGTGGPGSWGGHAVYVPYYDAEGLVCITWGATQRMNWEFWKDYCDESHTLLSKMWLDRAPADFKLGDLQSDLAALAG